MSGWGVGRPAHSMGEGGFGLVVPDADLPAEGLEAAHFLMLTPPAVGRGRECCSARCGRPVAGARRGRRARPVQAGSPHRGRLRSNRRVARRPDWTTSPGYPRRGPPGGRTGGARSRPDGGGRAAARKRGSRRRAADVGITARGCAAGDDAIATGDALRRCAQTAVAPGRPSLQREAKRVSELTRRASAAAARLGQGCREGWRQLRLRTRTSSAACRCGPGARTTKRWSRRAAQRRG